MIRLAEAGKVKTVIVKDMEARIMNANVNYIGMVNLLRALRNAGIISEVEARKIAARLRVETGADVIYSPQ